SRTTSPTSARSGSPSSRTPTRSCPPKRGTTKRSGAAARPPRSPRAAGRGGGARPGRRTSRPGGGPARTTEARRAWAPRSPPGASGTAGAPGPAGPPRRSPRLQLAQLRRQRLGVHHREPLRGAGEGDVEVAPPARRLGEQLRRLHHHNGVELEALGGGHRQHHDGGGEVDLPDRAVRARRTVRPAV